MIDRKKAVFFEKFLSQFRVGRHVYKDDTQAAGLQSFTLLGKIADGLATERAAEKAQENEQHGLCFGQLGQ